MIELICQCGDPTCELGCDFGSSIKEKFPDAFDTFINGYMKCALWASCCNIEPNQDHSFFDIGLTKENFSQDALEKIENDCKKFFQLAYNMIYVDPKMGFDDAGHDFWLTRNNYGGGFWDGDWMHGNDLTKFASSFATCDLEYENGEIWIL